MPSMDSLFGIHDSALKLRAQRMSMLASNIANAATPGYKARDIDFSSALQMATRGRYPPAYRSLPEAKQACTFMQFRRVGDATADGA
jgi:flagellar basal-body rod protein FlgB